MMETGLQRKWHRVCLRICGDGLPIDRVASQLGLVATFAKRKGDHPQGNPMYRAYVTNIWSWDYPSNPEVPFEEQIAGLLNVIEARKGALLELLAVPGVVGEIVLGFGAEERSSEEYWSPANGGATFSNSLLRRVVELSLSLEIDLYPPGESEDYLSEIPEGEA